MRGPWHLYGGETVDGDAAWDLFCAAADGHVPTIERLLAEDARLVRAQHFWSLEIASIKPSSNLGMAIW